MTEIAPYGTWTSPISAADVARGATSVSFPSIAGGEVWWQERQPAEGGRITVMAASGAAGTPRELLPAPWNARTRVHEYGGKAYLPVLSADSPAGESAAGQSAAGLSTAGGSPDTGFDLVFANFADQRLYLVRGGDASRAEPAPLTPAGAGFRFADLALSADGRELWCVRETSHPDDGVPAEGFHTGGGRKVQRSIVAVPLDGSAADETAAITELVTGAHFFAFPTPSPDGTNLAWIDWNHPQMPWDGTELRVAPVPAAGKPAVRVADAALVMGGPGESVLAPRWQDSGALYAISDASGWWNLYEVAAVAGAMPRPLYLAEEEFAWALWQLGGRAFELLADGRLAVLHGLGELHLGVLDPSTGALTDLDLPGFRHFEAELAVDGATVAGIAGGPRTPWSVLRVTVPDDAAPHSPLPVAGPELIRQQAIAGPGPAYLPDARPAQLSLGQNGPAVHAIVYPPSNPDVTAPAGELPPFVVHAHGGPTSNSEPVAAMERAYFTSRGIGIIAVNYGGSTGYGRAYRERLRGQWGIVDAADSMYAALALAESGDADRHRLGIRGGSAGGWTALVSVTSGLTLTSAEEPVFAAATSYYGVSDLRPFAADTHDFESRYLDGLIGPLPEAEALYAERAPVGHVTPLTCPILLLQGRDDPIVPPSQSKAIADDLAAHQIPHAYLEFEGESHGFRKAETVIAALEAELAFYGEVFGFVPPGVARIKLS